MFINSKGRKGFMFINATIYKQTLWKTKSNAAVELSIQFIGPARPVSRSSIINLVEKYVRSQVWV